jgi:hypothetical protein
MGNYPYSLVYRKGVFYMYNFLFHSGRYNWRNGHPMVAVAQVVAGAVVGAVVGVLIDSKYNR